MRKLKAIEIAEGALLADIAVVFQLVAVYLPVGDGFFRMLVIIVFVVLALRRGLYVGVMGGCVSLFIAAVIMGPIQAIPMLLGCAAGLFLGVTMKYRLRTLLILLLGTTCGALSLYALFMGSFFWTGWSPDVFIRNMQQNYTILISIVDSMMLRLGLGSWWQQSALPSVTAVSTWAFAYWWVTLYLWIWVFMWPAVFIIYGTANMLVRMLGYEVRPFLSGKLSKVIHKDYRRLVRFSHKHRLAKRRSAQV